MELRLILEAKLLKEYSKVCKATGTKKHTIRDSIKVYGEQVEEIKGKGVRYLFSEEGGHITAIREDAKVAIDGDEKFMLNFLTDIVFDQEEK